MDPKKSVLDLLNGDAPSGPSVYVGEVFVPAQMYDAVAALANSLGADEEKIWGKIISGMLQKYLENSLAEVVQQPTLPQMDDAAKERFAAVAEKMTQMTQMMDSLKGMTDRLQTVTTAFEDEERDDG